LRGTVGLAVLLFLLSRHPNPCSTPISPTSPLNLVMADVGTAGSKHPTSTGKLLHLITHDIAPVCYQRLPWTVKPSRKRRSVLWPAPDKDSTNCAAASSPTHTSALLCKCTGIAD
jgi:hypothetical protein